MESCGRHVDSRAARGCQTGSPAAVEGHYTRTGTETQYAREKI